MQVMSASRSKDLGITVQDIIQSKSISQLAERVTVREKLVYEEEDVNISFDLSPIQKMYFECVGDKWAHFNQSLLLQSAKKFSLGEVRQALDTIVKAHSMLRARFSRNEGKSQSNHFLNY
jgi:hypothetical protein